MVTFVDGGIGFNIACTPDNLWELAIVIPQECECLEYYGEAYRKYMNRTPGWIGIKS